MKFMPDGKRQVEAEDYEKNLRAVVTWMKTNGAKLTNFRVRRTCISRRKAPHFWQSRSRPASRLR